MTRQNDRKEETRRRLLAAAGEGFRAEGFAGIGVDAIARAAGATSGAFYAHLGSKDGAFLAALEIGLNESLAAIPACQQEHGADWVERFLEGYFGAIHRADRARGCAMTSLSPEIARAGDGAKAAFETRMAAIASEIAEGLEGGGPEERIARAWGFLGALIGGLTLARAMGTRQMADAVAHVSKAAARQAAGATRARP